MSDLSINKLNIYLFKHNSYYVNLLFILMYFNEKNHIKLTMFSRCKNYAYFYKKKKEDKTTCSFIYGHGAKNSFKNNIL